MRRTIQANFIHLLLSIGKQCGCETPLTPGGLEGSGWIYKEKWENDPY